MPSEENLKKLKNALEDFLKRLEKVDGLEESYSESRALYQQWRFSSHNEIFYFETKIENKTICFSIDLKYNNKIEFASESLANKKDISYISNEEELVAMGLITELEYFLKNNPVKRGAEEGLEGESKAYKKGRGEEEEEEEEMEDEGLSTTSTAGAGAGASARPPKAFGTDIGGAAAAAPAQKASPQKVTISVSYPMVDGKYNRKLPKEKKAIAHYAIREVLVDMLDIAEQQTDLLAIADLLVISNLISKSDDGGASEGLRALDFSKPASEIFHKDGYGAVTGNLGESLKSTNPTPATATFGGLYQARLRDLAIFLAKVFEKKQDLSPEMLKAYDLGKETFEHLLKDFPNKETEPLEIDKALYDSVAKNSFIMYRAQNGEICLKFPSQEKRDEVLRKFKLCTIPNQFCVPPQFTKSNNYLGTTPCIIPGCDNSIFFPTYTAGGGEIGVNFSSSENLSAFLELIKCPSEQSAGGVSSFYKTSDGKTLCTRHSYPPIQANTLYFTAPQIMNSSKVGSYVFSSQEGEASCIEFFRPELSQKPQHALDEVSIRRIVGANAADVDRARLRRDIEGSPHLDALTQLQKLGLIKAGAPSTASLAPSSAQPVAAARALERS